MSFINLLSEKIILPLADIATGQSVAKHLRFLQKSQWWSAEELRRFQEARLRKLIRHSVETVPYYKKLLNDHEIGPEDVRNVEDLKKIPILSKTAIKKAGMSQFTSAAVLPKQKMKKSSSGSTGEPLVYYITKEAYSFNIAANLRGWYSMGYRLGDRFVKLGQKPRAPSVKKIQDKINRSLYLKTNPLTEDNFESILRQIENYRPKYIRCYPDPLLFLARYKKQRQHFRHQPMAITTTGNTLHPNTRKEIERAFGCKVFDAYACEATANFFECTTHNGYHAAQEYGITEVVDEKGDQIKSGVGRIISTDLWNIAHPFIRYDTQDLAEIYPEPCACGRNHLRIKRILGRDNEVLVSESGRKFIVHDFATGFFNIDLPQLNRSIEQYQVVKKGSTVVFRLVANEKFTDTVADFIKNHWEKEFIMRVEVELVNNIPLTSSGKRRFIINEQ